jgi:hypothetical protein
MVPNDRRAIWQCQIRIRCDEIGFCQSDVIVLFRFQTQRLSTSWRQCRSSERRAAKMRHACRVRICFAIRRGQSRSLKAKCIGLCLSGPVLKIVRARLVFRQSSFVWSTCDKPSKITHPVASGYRKVMMVRPHQFVLSFNWYFHLEKANG